MKQYTELFTVVYNAICLRCKNKGAVQPYGRYFPHGVGELADQHKIFEGVRDEPYMSHASGFGGTLPYRCLNCGNIGLIDIAGLEGYKQAFKSIKTEM
ncbi:hypothetical protein ACFVHQ_12070 [Actinomycetes bacterium NPDC127524]